MTTPISEDVRNLDANCRQNSIPNQAHFIINTQHTLDEVGSSFFRVQNEISSLQDSRLRGAKKSRVNLRINLSQLSLQHQVLREKVSNAVFNFKRSGGDMENLAHGIYPRNATAQRSFIATFQQ
jgi:hypothetical protein